MTLQLLLVFFAPSIHDSLQLEDQTYQERKQNLDTFDLRQSIVHCSSERFEIRDDTEPQDAHGERCDDLGRSPGTEQHERAREKHLSHRASKLEPPVRVLILVVQAPVGNAIPRVLVYSFHCCGHLRWINRVTPVVLD